jgi:site-specific DNA-methyltransferase (adenine-specific)
MTTLKLFNADCLEQMKSIPDKSVGLIICDLPFGCLSGRAIGKNAEEKGMFGATKKTIQRADNPDKSNDREFCDWDIKINLELFWKQIRRIRKDDHTPCLHFCSTKFGYDLIKSNEKEFRYDMVWNKMRGVGFLSANKKPMVAHEMIYVFSKKGANYNRIDIEGEPYIRNRNTINRQYGTKVSDQTINTGSRCVISVIENHNSSGRKNGHPTAKPVELYKWLISRYSNEGDMVLDPTFGSANSGVASRELKRNYIGIEMNKEFFDKAEKSLGNTNEISLNNKGE